MNKRMIKRVLMSFLGVIVCAVGVGLFKYAALGMDPFQALMRSLEQFDLVDPGTLYVIANGILLLFSVFVDRHNIGLATFVNLFLVGYISDFTFQTLNGFSEEPAVLIRILCLAVGILTICFSSSVYMTADLGVSTYDAVAIVLSRKWKVAKFQYCRIATDLVCVVAGVAIFLLTGGKPGEVMMIAGVGTVITAFFLGPLVEFFNVKFSRPFLGEEDRPL